MLKKLNEKLSKLGELLFFDYVPLTFTALFVATAVAIGALIYANSTAEKLDLNVADWVCTDRAVRTIMQPVYNGVTTTMVPTTTTVCVQYNRR